jgi:glutamate racemase
MNSNAPICLFDSGIGGLTVLKKLANAFPNENYIYLADLARVPFGDKSKEELTNIVNEIVSWLEKFNPKAIITACNTSAALLADQQSSLVSIIDPVAKEIALSEYKEVTVWATKFTIENSAYKKAINKINPNVKVQEISCPKLVPVIENLECSIEEKIKIINEYMDQISPSSDALIYGCTHYPHIDEMVKKLRNIKTIDPADAVVKEIFSRDVARNVSTDRTPSISLYTTAHKEKLEKFSKLYLCGDYKVELVTLKALV